MTGLIFLIAATGKVSGANYITVATIGTTPSFDSNHEPQKLVNMVVAFWQREISQVLPDKPDLIVLPELCDFSKAGDEYLRIRKNQVLDFFASVAKTSRCYIAFGMKREESEGIWRNSCVLLDRDGRIAGIYDKNFPTIYEMEAGIKASTETPVFQCDFGRVACIICFDLNFDELRKQYEKLQPDIIMFPSAYHGGLEQSKWAYSCRSFFVGSCGTQTLPSEIRNPLGDVVASTTNYFNYVVATVNLDRMVVHLDYNREKLLALKEKYGEDVIINVPGKLGVAMITSEKEDVSAAEMIKEFKIELVDDYFNRSRQQRLEQLDMH
jgi:hypothetical protein